MAAIAIGGVFMLCISSAVGGGLIFIRTKNQDVRADQVASDAEQKLSKPFYHKLTKQHQPSSCAGEVLYSLQSESANLSADIKLDDVSSSILSRGEVPSCCLEFENLNLESLSYTLFGETHTKSNIKGDTKQVLNLSETRAITGGEQTACATDISAKFKILE
tara:strand:- start:1536 stop:2021 length:486 start_codon:yes stop_codon:yes gene_type:complete